MTRRFSPRDRVVVKDHDENACAECRYSGVQTSKGGAAPTAAIFTVVSLVGTPPVGNSVNSLVRATPSLKRCRKAQAG